MAAASVVSTRVLREAMNAEIAAPASASLTGAVPPRPRPASP